MKEYLKNREEEFEKEFETVPAITGEITDSDKCCNCGEDLGLELYDAFSKGYEMAIEDTKSHHSQTIKSLIIKIIEENEKIKCEERKVSVFGKGTNSWEARTYDEKQLVNAVIKDINNSLKELI